MRFNLFDISWDSNDMDSFNRLIIEHSKNNTQLTVSSVNLHAIYLYYKDPSVKKYIDTSAAHIDGMPVIWMLRMLGYKNLPASLRITWVDWMIPLLTFCKNNNIRVAYLGGRPGVAERGLRNIDTKVPGLIYKTFDGYFKIAPIENAENVSRIKEINDFMPNLLIVGMGMGRQEKWIHENKKMLTANVIITSGAAAEYFSGDVNTPPRWMGTLGLEWLYRFAENPKRFWFRYLIEPWFILGLFFKKKK